MFRCLSIALILVVCASGGALAQPQTEPEPGLKQQLVNYIEKKLGGQFTVASAKLNIRPNVHEVLLDDGTALYVLGDSEYFVVGDLWYFSANETPINLTDSNARRPLRIALVETMNTQDLIIFPAIGERKTSITVFTDVDCGYCRKLHQEVPALNQSGVEVRYAAFPRLGPSSATADKMVNAWCAQDPQGAITRLKRGESIETANCINNVSQQHEVGLQLGITGTPSIVTEDGKLLPGYLTAPKLLEWLEI